MNPLISCICPTYGRIPHNMNLLQEMLYWFVQQTYDNKELVIFNDCPKQRIVCNVQNVRVINSASRYKTLGEKYNAMVEAAKGEIIVPWEDDDVSLPNRLAQAEEKLREGREYFNPQQSWFEQSGKLYSQHIHGVCHNASAYRKDLWKRVGAYDLVTGEQDRLFDNKCKLLGSVAPSLHCDKDWTYIYRWGVSPIHLSGASDMQALYDKVPVESGIVILEPVRFRDYTADVRAHLENVKCQGTCSGKCKR